MTSKVFGLIITAIMALWILDTCISDAPDTSLSPAIKAEHKAEIADYALPNYTPDSYPRTFAA